MSLSGSALGDAIATALGVSGNAAAKSACEALGGAIVTYLTANAVITITTPALASTVCGSPGSPLTGAITTTLPGTIS